MNATAKQINFIKSITKTLYIDLDLDSYDVTEKMGLDAIDRDRQIIRNQFRDLLGNSGVTGRFASRLSDLTAAEASAIIEAGLAAKTELTS